MQLPCKHKFHKSCIETALQSKAECPSCKDNVASGIERMRQ